MRKVGAYGLAMILGLRVLPTAYCGIGRGDVVVVESTETRRSQKEALLILPGFGSKTEGVRDIRAYFSRRGYDLFVPAYIGRDSIEQCVANLDRFLRERRLAEYRRVHVFSYILGGWTLNRWVRIHPRNNIATIVYDRSPLQERAAYAMARDSPFLTRLAVGPIVEEFSKTPYEALPNDAKNIGVVIESRATKLVRKHKKTVLALGKVNWSASGTNQAVDDYFYTLNDHDAMYHDLSIVGREVLYFIRNGRFSADVPRTRPDIDPFMPSD